MRIVLDVQGAQGEGRFRGVERYTLSLARAIVRQRSEHEFIVALSDLYPETVEPIRGLFDGHLPQEQIRLWQAPGPVRASEAANDWRRTAAKRIREAFLASLEPDIVHISDLFGEDVVSSVSTLGVSCRTVVTLYDLIPLLNPDTYLSPYPRFKRHYLDTVAQAKRADGWLAISESSAREGRNALGLDPNSVVNVSAACDAIFRRLTVSRADEDRLRERYDVSRPYVMYSGGADSRKNLHRLIQAYAHLSDVVRQAHQLVLVGKMIPEQTEALRATARAAGLRPDDLRFTGFVSDDDLVLLYNISELFVLPSVHEGFGLPALEAMSCGAAVIGANLASLPEVIGWSDALFDPFDVASISAKIARALTDTGFRAELILRGTEQAQRFSWEESARRSIGAFERFHEARTVGSVQRTNAPERVISQLVRELRAVPGSPQDQDLIGASRAISRNHPQTSERRLLVDVSELIRRDARSGIQRVVRSLLMWLPRQLPSGHQMEPVFASTDRPGYRDARRSDADAGAPRVPTTETVMEPRPGDIFLGLDLQHFVVVAQSEFYAELRRLGIPVYFVVYDLLPVLMPHRFTPDLEAIHQQWLQVVCAADGALCISRSVADELRAWQQTNGSARHRPFHIGWFHLGADIEHSDPTHGLPDDATKTLREITARPTFLLVATLEPRKGHAQTLAAFDRLWATNTDVNLVFVGTHGWHMEELVTRLRRHPESGRRLFWLDGISDEFLGQVYRASTCLIVPSEGEGFGLPLIEAAHHGTPILARDIPVFREVAGEHAFYFRGLDPVTLADAVRKWLTLWGEGRHPRPDDITWLTWEQSAAQVVDFLLGNRLYSDVLPAPGSTS